MKKFFLFFISSFILQYGFCEKKPLTDESLDFQCSLEMDNLSGNIKEMTHYRQNMINGKIDSLRLYRKTRYNKNEKLVYEEEYFSKYGAKQFDNSYTFTYDDFNRPIKKISVVPFYKDAYFETNYKYIDESNRIEQYAIEDYSGKNHDKKPVKYDRIELAVFDSLQNPIYESSIQNNDTTITIRKYIYNSFGKYTFVFNTFKTKSGIQEDNEEDAYDVNQNITKQVFFNKDKKIDYGRELKYNENNKVESLSESFGDSIVNVTRFSDKLLPIEKQLYKKGILQTDEFYQYNFDNKNNWIEKKVLSQNIIKGEKEAKLTSVETRLISYFE
jgi:hypothetical protein